MLYAEPGTEQWIPLAQRELRRLRAALALSGAGIGSRRVEPTPGVVVLLRTTPFRDLVYITGASDLRYNGWLNAPFMTDAASVQFPFLARGKAPYHRQFLAPYSGAHLYRTTWSKDGSTFVALRATAIAAYGEGSAVVRRGSYEQTVLAVCPFPDARVDASSADSRRSGALSHAYTNAPAAKDFYSTGTHRGHFRFLDAAVSRDGKRIVFNSTVDGEVCVVLKWNSDAGAYTETRVAYPAQITAKLAFSPTPAAYAGRDKAYTGSYQAHVANETNTAAPFVNLAGIRTVLANPYDASEVLVHFDSLYIDRDERVATVGTSGVVQRGSGTSSRYALRYDVVLGTWSTVYALDRDFWRYAEISGDGTNPSAPMTWGGFTIGGSTTADARQTVSTGFEPEGAVLLGYEGWTVTTPEEPSFPGLGLPSEVLVAKSAITILRNGVSWIAGVTTGGGQVFVPQLGVGGTGLLALTAAGGALPWSYTWKYGAAAADKVALTGIDYVGMTKSGRQLLYKTGGNWVLRVDGAVKWQSNLDANAGWFGTDQVLVYTSFDSPRFVGVVNGTYRSFLFAPDSAASPPNPYKAVLLAPYALNSDVYDMLADGTEPDPTPASGSATATDFALAVAIELGFASTAALAAFISWTEADIVAAAQDYMDGSKTALENVFIDYLIVANGFADLAELLANLGITEAELRAAIDGSLDGVLSGLGGTPATTGRTDVSTLYFLPGECVGAA